MYISIRDDIVLATGFNRLDEGLRHYGLDAVELAVDREYRVRAVSPDAGDFVKIDTDEGVEALQAQCRSAGVRVSALLMPNNFNAPDRDVEIAWAVRTVHVAKELGAPAVRIDAIMHGERDIPLEQRQEIVAAAIREILARTEGVPVDLGIENHGFQGNDPAFLTGLMDRVGSPRLGLTMDTGNFYWRGHPLDRVYAILEQFAPLAKHTHIKNIAYPEEMRNVEREIGYGYEQYVCPIPEGDIDHARVVGLLKAAGYDRDLCLEDESLGKYSMEERRANIRAAVDYFRAML